jgi:hypothetical protein
LVLDLDPPLPPFLNFMLHTYLNFLVAYDCEQDQSVRLIMVIGGCMGGRRSIGEDDVLCLRCRM